MEGLLASIFGGFWWIWEAKLGGKSSQNHFQAPPNDNQNSARILTSSLETSRVIFVGATGSPDAAAAAVLGGS